MSTSSRRCAFGDRRESDRATGQAPDLRVTIFNWGLTREPYRAVYGQGDTSPDHPLWRLPNVLVSPHVAGDSARSLARAYALAGDQIRLFAAGERLVNEVPPNLLA